MALRKTWESLSCPKRDVSVEIDICSARSLTTAINAIHDRSELGAFTSCITTDDSFEALVSHFERHGSQRKRIPICLNIHEEVPPNQYLDEQNLTLLLDALRLHRSGSVDGLTFNVDMINRLANTTTLARFFNDMGNMANLSEFRLCHHQMIKAPIAGIMSNLGKVVTSAKNLSSITFENISFDKACQGFVSFADALSGHKKLKKITLNGCEFLTGKATPDIQVLLAGPPSTSMVCASNPQYAQRAISLPLHLILGLRMKALCIDPGFRGRHHLSGAHSLLSCSTAYTMRNNSYLEVLSLPVDFGQKQECALLAKIVQHNKALRSLTIIPKPFRGDNSVALIIQALEKNSTLEELVFRFGTDQRRFLCEDNQNAFVSLVEKHNFTLRSIQFTWALAYGNAVAPLDKISELETVKKIKFFVKLNEYGRKVLQAPNAPKDVWIGILGKATLEEDVASTFYFLAMNPSLCNTSFLPMGGTKRSSRSGLASSESKRSKVD